MVSRFSSLTIMLIALILAGCSGAPSPYKGTWTATPQFREVNNSFCNARLTPQKGNRSFYSLFHLTVVNTSGKALVFDWNSSRYLHEGKPKGVLVFEGIDPEAVKNGTVPLETVSPGGRLERNLMPRNLIAWNPIKHSATSERGITPGMLPAGENGILLFFRQAGVRVSIPMSVLLSLEKQP